MSDSISELMKDVNQLVDLGSTGDEHQIKFLIKRIELAALSLRGQDRPADDGPWSVSADGRHLESDCFEHDVRLQISGDFYGDGDRIAYAKRLAAVLNSAKELPYGLPKKPPMGLLWSMATRLHHDFSLDRLEGQVGGTTKAERDQILGDMQRLYDEVAGHGFFKWKGVTSSTEG